MKLSDVYGEYIRSNNLYDKYGIATVTLKRYRNKEGKRIVSLEDAWKLEPTVYVKGSWQKVAKYMQEHMGNFDIDVLYNLYNKLSDEDEE